MPTISMFFGIIIRMYFMDTQQHHRPHLHIEYQGQKSIVLLPDGEFGAPGGLWLALTGSHPASPGATPARSACAVI